MIHRFPNLEEMTEPTKHALGIWFTIKYKPMDSPPVDAEFGSIETIEVNVSGSGRFIVRAYRDKNGRMLTSLAIACARILRESGELHRSEAIWQTWSNIECSQAKEIEND